MVRTLCLPSRSPQRLAAVLSRGALLAAALAPAVRADVAAPGFTLAEQPVIAGSTAWATLANGDLVVFDGLSVDRYDASGVFQQSLGSVPSFVFPSLVEADPTESFAIVAESSNGDVFRVALDGSGMTAIANICFNYDAEFAPDGSVIVSAASSCMFGSGNDVIRLDPASGAWTVRAHVPGPSGPVAVDAAGDVFYATASDAFPPPPGASDVLRWSAAQIAAGGLDETDAALVAGGFDGATALELAPRTGRLYLAAPVFGDPTAGIHAIDPGSGAVLGTVATTGDWISNLEFLEGRGLGTFQAYQPALGVRLRYASDDFAGGAMMVDLDPARPVLTHSKVGQIVTLTVTGGPADAGFAIFWNDVADYTTPEVALELGFGFPFVSGMDFARLRRIGFYLPLDASGTGSFTYFDGNDQFAGTLVFQTLVVSPTLVPLGTSTAAFN